MNNTIRFKRGDIEFEMTGSQADLAKAWAALEGSVVAAFQKSATTAAGKPAATATPDRTRKKSTRRRAPSARTDSAKSDVRAKLGGAKLDSFPEVGKNPPALETGYAVLRWARDELGITELTVPDIHAVAHRLRIPHSVNAYREAFRNHPRAANKTNKTPATYELMNPGDDALESYLKAVASGGSPAEAEAQAAEAERAAKS